MRDRTAYHPEGLQTWDVWYAVEGTTVHAFYLQKPSPDVDPSILRWDWIGHAASEDLVAWRELPRALGPDGSSDIDDLQPWTGSALWHEGRSYLFFTMRGSRTPSARVQRIGLATSEDGSTWRRVEGLPVLEADPEIYEADPTGVVDCRDLLVIEDPDSDGWLGFYAARIRGRSLSGGAAIASAHSRDLVNWEHRGTVFAPAAYACLEVPDVFELDGRWYLTCLVGNRYGNRVERDGVRLTNGTIYAVADHPLGPYRELPGDRWVVAGDVTSGYSCQTVRLDGIRYLLYTEPTASGRDSISPPFELSTAADGELRLLHSRLAERLRARRAEVGRQLRQLTPTPHWPQTNGDWSADGAAAVLHGAAHGGWHVAADRLAGDAFEVVATFVVQGRPTVGFALGATDAATATGCLLVGVDTAREVAVAATLPDFVDAIERALPDELAPQIRLRLLVRGERVQLYVDDVLWLQFSRPWNASGATGVGWFVENGAVEVTGVEAWVLGLD